MPTLKFLRTTFSLVAALTSLSAFAGPPAYSLLKNARPFIKLPEYSVEQKKLVLDQARLILSQIYINRELKIKDFGPTANPIPYLNKIESELSTISDLSFHKQLSDIFFRFRDLHTLYYLPKPFACYDSFLPFTFKEVTAANGKKVIAVSTMRDDAAVLKFMPKPFRLKIGDIVTSYNGLSIEKAIQANMDHSLGANPSAARRKSIENLRFYQHNLDLLPEKDSTKFEFQTSEGEKYKMEIPWVTWKDWNCVGQKNNLAVNTVRKAPMAEAKKDRADVDQTGESTLYWQINKTKFGNFGYIELMSFDPIDVTVNEVVTKVKNLLQNELKNTDGLMIDLRGNTGGRLPLAERMIQLFSPHEIQPHTYILRNSEANAFYTALTPMDLFTKALEEAQRTNSPFTKKLPIDSVEEVNDLGQVYFKPVAVYVDSNCYSACDTFAAHVQDHKVATVFGEDQTTGGGGANVFSLDEILEDFEQYGVDSGIFKKLPNGQNITFAFRQAFRSGVNQGKLIEDIGVKVDRISAPSMSDQFNSNNDQILVLERFLQQESKKYTSNIFLANEDRQDFLINKKAKLIASWNDTTGIEFKVDGRVREARAIKPAAVNAAITLPAVIETNTVGDGRFEILGSSKDKRVWRKVINYRIVPESKVIGLNQSLKINLKDNQSLALYTHNTQKQDGWNISNNSLYLGDGSYYADMSFAEASLFVTLPVASYELKFDAAVKIEKDLDYMKVIAIVNGKEVVLIDKLSGDLPMKNYKVDLAQFQGQAIEIRFVFESDPETTDKGITIKNISLTPVLK
ncbi:S41 family peptidase [Bacteriovorax sp. PP10]|uniref:S41 family peptidase n=1 Tax=Bacteriovorax antarcticus TaxID=3088717 RepID=A0ABU5VW86_9BACT|nr:S41 family peptidase [Bacteriovorax sp. PP10]MEA9357306.1 S41 family peptidase [Bacteriovorax sp. PP10]